MGCGMGMIKYLLFIFNFIFALGGLAILVVGVIVHLEIKNYKNTVEENIIFPSITLIVLGSIIFIIAFFGCCGAIRESHCMTITFASFLLTILIIQVAVAVYAFVVLKDTDPKLINKTYTELFKKYWDTDGNKEAIDVIQQSLTCCGINSANDFVNIHNGTIPGSCCGKSASDACNGADNIYTSGCVEKIQTFIKQAGTILGGIAFGIGGVELIGIIFALCLANSIRNSERRGYRV